MVILHSHFRRGLWAACRQASCRARRTLGELPLESGLILLEAHAGAGARLDPGLRSVHGKQAVLPALDLVGQVDAAGKRRLVSALGQS